MANKYKVNFQITFYEVEENFDTTEAIREELKGKNYTVTGGEVNKEDNGYTVDDFVHVEIQVPKNEEVLECGEKNKSLVDVAQDVLILVDSANSWFSITDSEDNLIYEEE